MPQVYDMTGASAGVKASGVHYVRGLLMAKLRRDIEWMEFCRMAKLSRTTINNIVSGRGGGSPESATKLMDLALSNGLPVTWQDLVEEPRLYQPASLATTPTSSGS